MSAPTEITCTPRDGILRITAETMTALDRLGATLPDHTPWQVDVLIGTTPADTIRITAAPATAPAPEGAA